ncbi:hypothetical protein QVD17_03388 [Tagetes erecta]|uniref:GTP-eEF1A C-terminal domain-containing protein n=1 Tax=Tagetes erecta TaxID=13708 RepID=A0AAD8L898_TARER|nr:hypothetical protein QVD17_03388 [Tagetes erecta]
MGDMTFESHKSVCVGSGPAIESFRRAIEDISRMKKEKMKAGSILLKSNSDCSSSGSGSGLERCQTSFVSKEKAKLKSHQRVWGEPAAESSLAGTNIHECFGKFLEVVKKVETEDKLKMRREKVTADVILLKSRFSKSISTVITGLSGTGKTTIKTKLLNDKNVVQELDSNIRWHKIKQICLADMVIQVLDANRNVEVEHTMDACIVFSLGFNEITFSCNKMDLVANPEDAFRGLVNSISQSLIHLGFDEPSRYFVPTVALQGGNIVERSTRFPWYNGLTVSETLDGIHQPSKNDKPLRFVVEEVTKGLVIGRVHTGKLVCGRCAVFFPGSWSTSVDQITVGDMPVVEAYSGEQVVVRLKDPIASGVRQGSVVSYSDNDPVGEADILTAKIFVLSNEPASSRIFFSCMLCCHAVEVSVCIAGSFREGQAESNSMELRIHDTGFVLLVPNSRIAVENVEDYPSLGRIMLLDISTREVLGTGVIVHRETDTFTSDEDIHQDPQGSTQKAGPSTKKAGPRSKKAKKKKKRSWA